MKQIIIIFLFALASYSSIKLINPNQFILYGEFVESNNFNFFWHDVLYPWNNYLSLGHTNLSFPHSSSYVSGQIFGTFFSGGHIYWLALQTALQALSGPNHSYVYIFLSVFFPFVSMYIFAVFVSLHFFSKSRLYPVLASIIFAISPQAVSRIQVGSLRYCLGYALLPLVILFVYRYLLKKRNADLLIGGLFFILMFYIQAHFVLIYGIIGLILCIFNSRLVKLHLFWGLLLLGTSIHLWLPAIIFHELNLITPNDYFTGANIAGGLGTNLSQMLSLSAGTLSSTNSYGLLENQDLIYAFAFTILTIAAFIKRKTGFLLPFFFIFMIALIFGAGTRLPFFGSIVGFLYLHLSPLHAFRDTTKFMAIILLSYSLIIPSVLLYKTKTSFFALVVILLMLINFSKTFFSGNFGQTATTFSLPGDYQYLANKLSGRVLYLAAKKSIQGAQDYQWYPAGKNPSLMATPFDALTPFSGATLSKAGAIGESYSTRFLSYLEPLCSEKYYELLLEKTATNWVVQDNWIRSGIVPSLGQCNTNPALEKAFTIGHLTVYSLPGSQIVKTDNQALLAWGNFDLLNYLGKTQNPLLNLPIIFMQQNAPLGLDRLLSFPGSVFVYNTSLTEATLSLAYHKLIDINFSKVLDNPLNSKKYWIWDKGTVNNLTQKTGDFVFAQTPIYTTDVATVSSTFRISSPGYYQIFAHVLVGPQTLPLQFAVDNKFMTSIPLESKYTGLLWRSIYLDYLPTGSHSISVTSSPLSFTFLDKVSVISAQDFNDSQSKLQTFMHNRTVQAYYSPDLAASLPDWDMIASHSGQIAAQTKKAVQYSQYSPTLIRVSQEKVNDSPKLLTFRESYSPYWLANNQAPFMVDGYANGYLLSNSESVNLEYAATNVYRLSLALSMVCMGLIIFWIIWPIFRLYIQAHPQRFVRQTSAKFPNK